jgi:hypothetical protein
MFPASLKTIAPLAATTLKEPLDQKGLDQRFPSDQAAFAFPGVFARLPPPIVGDILTVERRN